MNYRSTDPIGERIRNGRWTYVRLGFLARCFVKNICRLVWSLAGVDGKIPSESSEQHKLGAGAVIIPEMFCSATPSWTWDSPHYS